MRQCLSAKIKDLHMIAAIYRFHLQPDQVETYKQHWDNLTNYFIDYCGAIGSCLHQGDNGLWLAYSRWPDNQTRQNAWPGDGEINPGIPDNIKETLKGMRAIRQENQHLPQYEPIIVHCVNDKLLNN